MRRTCGFCPSHLALFVFGVAMCAATLSAAQIGITGSGLRVDSPARSLKDLRDQNIVKQQFDYSCGAAALATMLRYGFGENVTERDIVAQLFGRLSEPEKADRIIKGFSLLDLQGVAQDRGYNAQGFRLAPGELTSLGGPVIVFIEPRGYKHFAVLRGVRDDRAYLADPSRGNVRMADDNFLKDWLQPDGKGIIFVVEPKTGLPDKTALNLPQNLPPRMEIMTAREMLAVGNALRLPELLR